MVRDDIGIGNTYHLFSLFFLLYSSTSLVTSFFGSRIPGVKLLLLAFFRVNILVRSRTLRWNTLATRLVTLGFRLGVKKKGSTLSLFQSWNHVKTYLVIEHFVVVIIVIIVKFIVTNFRIVFEGFASKVIDSTRDNLKRSQSSASSTTSILTNLILTLSLMSSPIW